MTDFKVIKGGDAGAEPLREKRDLGDAFMDLETDICDLSRMAEITSIIAMKLANGHKCDGLLIFSVDKLQEMVEALKRRHYDLHKGPTATA